MFQPQQVIAACELCGQAKPLVTLVVDMTNGYPVLLCNNCYGVAGSCQACTINNTCDFHTNPSPLPKFIQRQYRQGPMTSVIQEKNPERIEITCKVNCECYDDEIGCLREVIGQCDKHDFIIKKERDETNGSV